MGINVNATDVRIHTPDSILLLSELGVVSIYNSYYSFIHSFDFDLRRTGGLPYFTRI